tara:strand:- start:35 stop:664 length:630 start_codon:yes stop_codon:yes gene_type:complete
MKWFKHDSTANMDAKLQSVLLEYGMEGYGLYWYCLELIAQTVTPENITFNLQHDSRIIARNTGLGVQKVQEIMTHFVNIKLFQSNNGLITCLKLANRTDDYITKITRKSVQSTDIVRTLSGNVPLEEIRQEEIRLEKKREKDLKKYSVFSVPDITDIQSYISEMGYPVDAVAFYNFYESKGWMVGSNKMKSWQAAIRTWNTNIKKGTFK